MWDSLGWGEMSVLVVLALFVFGPERLPELASQLAQGIRRGRTVLHSLTDELKQELGPEVDELATELRQLGPGELIGAEAPPAAPSGGAPRRRPGARTSD